MKRYYLSGPISGPNIEANLYAFAAAAYNLSTRGYLIDSPADLIADEGTTWEEYMAACIPMAIKCHGIIMLPGWEYSRGADLERYIMHSLCREVLLYDDLIGACARPA